jgi:hypothetical protein
MPSSNQISTQAHRVRLNQAHRMQAIGVSASVKSVAVFAGSTLQAGPTSGPPAEIGLGVDTASRVMLPCGVAELGVAA